MGRQYQLIEPKSSQEQPKTFSRRPKTPPRGSQEPPRAAQERPKTQPRRPKTPPGALLRMSWGYLGTIRSQGRKPGRSGPMVVRVLGRFWPPKRRSKRPQDVPLTIQNSRRKMYHFFTALGPVLNRSRGDLGPVLESILAIF